MLQTIAVGTDGSPTAGQAVDFALDLAEKYGARVLILSSYHPVSESRLKQEKRDAPEDVQWSINPLEDVEATLSEVEEKAESRGLKWHSEAREGDPADVLCDLAGENGADLLVIGNKGMHRRLIGSVPNSVSHKAPCSVTIVKTT